MRAGHADREPSSRRSARIGVTRLSLGVENFDDRILELNGRAHRSPEIGQAYALARALDFPQINIDLIAGMLGETEENWQRLRREDARARARQRHHLPDGAAVQHDDQQRPAEGHAASSPSRSRTGRPSGAGCSEAFEALERAGYHVGSAYTAVKDPSRTQFVYRDRLWQGADMVGLGVASFGHVNGVHMQNLDTWETYSAAIERGEIPLSRAYRPTDEERLIRELVLQLKLGSVRPGVFPRQVRRRTSSSGSATQFASLAAEGYLAAGRRRRRVADAGRSAARRPLLPRFFLPQHAGIRYT